MKKNWKGGRRHDREVNVAQAAIAGENIRALSLKYAMGEVPLQNPRKRGRKNRPSWRDAYDNTSAEEFITGKAKPRVYRRKVKKHKSKAAKERHAAFKSASRAYYLSHIDSPEWKAFRIKVFAERGRKCERCGLDDDSVRHVHHRHYKTLGNESPEDVLVLCKPCHRRMHPTKMA